MKRQLLFCLVMGILVGGDIYAQNIFPTAGNTGIGTASPLERLQLGDRWTFHDGGHKVIGENFTYSGSDKRIVAAPSAALRFGVGNLYLQVAPSGEAGSGISWITGLAVLNTGNVGIGTTNPGSYKLAVEGTLGARELVATTAPWADFVFKPSYQLRPLSQVECYIQANGHLPDVPTEEQVAKDGNNLAKTDALLLQKIEELTLYLLQQQKEIEALKAKLSSAAEQR